MKSGQFVMRKSGYCSSGAGRIYDYFFAGLGFKKRDFMHFSKCPAAISAMHQIKQVFDPHMLMNPYKVLPSN